MEMMILIILARGLGVCSVLNGETLGCSVLFPNHFCLIRPAFFSDVGSVRFENHGLFENERPFDAELTANMIDFSLNHYIIFGFSNEYINFFMFL